MAASRRVLSDLNGPWSARVMFVAEAPGRLGAERTGIPLYGDRTGDRFGELLELMRLPRASVFITNAALCNPRKPDGTNGTPTPAEIHNCSAHLRRTLDAVQPLLVVALGRVALDALARIEPHQLTLRDDAGRIAGWGERHLAVLYHPAPRSVVHRPLDRQRRDAAAVAAGFRKLLDLGA